MRLICARSSDVISARDDEERGQRYWRRKAGRAMEAAPRRTFSSARARRGCFVELQEARHQADYDLAHRLTRTEVIDLVEQVERATAAWKSIRKTQPRSKSYSLEAESSGCASRPRPGHSALTTPDAAPLRPDRRPFLRVPPATPFLGARSLLEGAPTLRQERPMAAYQYIYVMKRLTKIYPGGRKVLENITLAFLPGAKIGVLGLNGAGKSTLLRIMAGVDHDFAGEAWAAEGVTRRLPAAGAAARSGEGRARQRHGGRGRDQGAARPLRRGLGRLRRSRCRRDGRADGRAGRAAGEDRRGRTPGNSSARSRSRWTRCAARRAIRTSRRSRAASGAGSRSAGCCWRSPTCCCSTSRPTTSTPNRSPGSSASCRTTRAPSSRSPTTATSSTTSPAGSSSSTAATASPGRATTRPGSSRSRSASRRRRSQEAARQRTLARELEWIRAEPARPPGQEQGAHHRLRGPAGQAEEQRARPGADHHPAGPAARRPGDRGRASAEGLRRPPADRRPRASACRPAASSA